MSFCKMSFFWAWFGIQLNLLLLAKAVGTVRAKKQLCKNLEVGAKKKKMSWKANTKTGHCKFATSLHSADLFLSKLPDSSVLALTVTGF